MVSDREILISLFNLVGELSRRLTGEVPMVCAKNDKGEYVHVYPDPNHVHWFNEKPSALLGRTDHHLGYHSMPCPLHAERPDNPKNP